MKSNCEGLSKELNQTEVSYGDRYAAERLLEGQLPAASISLSFADWVLISAACSMCQPALAMRTWAQHGTLLGRTMVAHLLLCACCRHNVRQYRTNLTALYNSWERLVSSTKRCAARTALPQLWHSARQQSDGQQALGWLLLQHSCLPCTALA